MRNVSSVVPCNSAQRIGIDIKQEENFLPEAMLTDPNTWKGDQPLINSILTHIFETPKHFSGPRGGVAA